MPGKLGVTSTQRKTMLRNLASDLLWYGKIETTLARAKELKPYVEKIITLAVNSYTDTISETVTVTVKDAKGKEKETTKKVFKDGAKKLAARRKIMTLTHDIPDAKQVGEKNADYKARVKGIIFYHGSPYFSQENRSTARNTSLFLCCGYYILSFRFQRICAPQF